MVLMYNLSLDPPQFFMQEEVTLPLPQEVTKQNLVRKPFPALLCDLPNPLLYRIIEDFCDCDNVLAIERTARSLFLNLQKFWKESITSKNLFLFVIKSVSVDLKNRKIDATIKVYEVYQKTKCEVFEITYPIPASGPQPTEEDNFQNRNIANPCKSIFLSTWVKQYIYKANREFLLKFHGDLQIVSSSCENGKIEALKCSTLVPKSLLESRSKEDILFKKIWLQLKIASQNIKKHIDYKKPTNSQENLTDQFETEALHLLTYAATHDYSELFTLLQNYRAHQSVLSNEYHQFNNFLMYQSGICKENPERLRQLITTFKVDHVKFNMKPSYPAFPKEWHFSCLNNNHGFYSKTTLKSALDFFYTRNSLDNCQTRKIPQLEVINLLLAFKANVNEPGIIEYALKENHSGHDLLNLLLENKANVNQIGEKGQTPLGQALLSASKSDPAFTEGVVSILLKAKADLNGCNIMGETPIMIAVTSCTAKLFKHFNSFDPIRYLPDFSGQTALMKAVSQRGCVEKIRALLAPRKLSIILDQKKSKSNLIPISKEEINRFDNKGETALSHALKNQNNDTLYYVKLLLEANADVNSLSENDKESLIMLTQTASLPHAVNFLRNEQTTKKKKRNQQESGTEFQNTTKRLQPMHSMDQSLSQSSNYPFRIDLDAARCEATFPGSQMMDISWLNEK